MQACRCHEGARFAVGVTQRAFWHTVERYGDLLRCRSDFRCDGVLISMPISYALLKDCPPERIPELWAFLEAGAAWVPYVLQEKYRGDKGLPSVSGLASGRSRAICDHPEVFCPPALQ